jgi:hypothetical protein
VASRSDDGWGFAASPRRPASRRNRIGDLRAAFVRERQSVTVAKLPTRVVVLFRAIGPSFPISPSPRPPVFDKSSQAKQAQQA